MTFATCIYCMYHIYVAIKTYFRPVVAIINCQFMVRDATCLSTPTVKHLAGKCSSLDLSRCNNNCFHF